MKKLFLLALFVVATFAGVTQSPTLTKEDYLQKSKKQKKAAVILLSGGAAMTLTGAIIGTNSAMDELSSIITEGENDKSFVAAGVMMFTGVVAMAGSVPFFIAAGKNKKRAEKITAAIKIEKGKLLVGQSISIRPYPAASLKISL